MTQAEFEAISADPTKAINGNITWTEDEDHSLSVEFRRDIYSQTNYPLFVQGRYNRAIGKLRYSVIHRGAGRILGLCMGSDHHNPACDYVGGDRHLHIWNDVSRDKNAVVAGHIVATQATRLQYGSNFVRGGTYCITEEWNNQ
jgi:hypothetical protein